MIYFNNDYNHVAYHEILSELEKTKNLGYPGYGEDEWCDKSKELIRKIIKKPNADIFFFPGATQANFVITAAALRPTQSVISADCGHINCHEAASIENTGHKILQIPAKDGKISAAQIRECAESFFDNGMPEYLTEPKMVYLSFPTELGTLYSLKELREISEVCRKYEMYLFVDGARLGYGLGAETNDVKITDLAELTDVFYIGGTKCGAMFGEAVIITAESLKYRFKSYMKQNGAVLAKGWLMGLQFYKLLSDGAYFRITEEANKKAMKIKKAFEENNIPFYIESDTNQQFVILTEKQEKFLSHKYIYEFQKKYNKDCNVFRFCTSWSTTWEDTEELVADIGKMPKE